MKRSRRMAKWSRTAAAAAVLSSGTAFQAGGCQVDVPDLNTQVGVAVQQDPRALDAQDRFFDTFDRALGVFEQQLPR